MNIYTITWQSDHTHLYPCFFHTLEEARSYVMEQIRNMSPIGKEWNIVLWTEPELIESDTMKNLDGTPVSWWNSEYENRVWKVRSPEFPEGDYFEISELLSS